MRIFQGKQYMLGYKISQNHLEMDDSKIQSLEKPKVGSWY